ncbi:MAG TPA: PA2779 family protein [Geminicoccaceae bacterium]|nr:PA2779 family protein [Geminicoccaceae bacterium]
MKRFQQICRAVALPLAVVMFLSSLPLGMARAALVGTERAVAGRGAAAVAADGEQRERVLAFVQREDVRRQMETLGVDPTEAASRVAGLTDGEVREIAGHLDRLPAGEGAVGALIGAVVLIFLVLLLTDLLGLTNVVPFVRR